MIPETENKKNLESFFIKEYQSLKAYVDSRVRAGVDRDAEDIIQDVALNLFSGADRYSPITNVAGFVYRSIKNKIIDVLRKERPKTVESKEDDYQLQEFAELMYGPSDNAYSDALIGNLRLAIENLKTPYRDILLAVDFEGYTYREIADETGIPEGTLMSRRHRAIAVLYKQLENKKENNH